MLTNKIYSKIFLQSKIFWLKTMISLEDMNLKFNIALQNGTSPEMIHNGDDYQLVFREADTLENCIEFFQSEEVSSMLNLSINMIIVYYFLLNKPSEVDIELARTRLIGVSEDKMIDYILEQGRRITDANETFKKKAATYNANMSKLNDFERLKSSQTEVSNVKRFIIKTLDGKVADVSNILDFFNKIEPSSKVQVIVFCNSDGLLTFKVNSEYPVRFGDELLTPTFVPKNNTITLFCETIKRKAGFSCKKTTLSFETGMCTIEVYEGKQNDNTVFYVTEVCEPVAILEEDNSMGIISGYIEFEIPSEINYDEFYYFLMLDELASSLFKVDESNKIWCTSKDSFKIIYYDPLTYVLGEFLGGTSFPFVTIEIPMEVTNRNKYALKFKTKVTEIIDSMENALARVISKFRQRNFSTGSFNYESAFSSTPFIELKERAKLLFDSTSLSKGTAYTSSCPSGLYPSLIKDVEVPSYELAGRDIAPLHFKGKDYFFTCLRDRYPKLVFSDARVIVKSGNAVFPCCRLSEKKKKSEKTEIVKTTSKVMKTAAIKDYGHISVIESGNLVEFFKFSFQKEGNLIPRLVGTCFYKSLSTKKSEVDSAIGALLFATDQYKVRNYETFHSACIDVRKRMIELPFDIFRQELYDVPRDEFVNRMLDLEHYIDPYLYYRGLEEIFNVCIFVFTSERNRQNSSSLDEFYSTNPTLEIPRCKDYHTRFYQDRNIVCLFKNYGLSRSISDIPACELIVITGDDKKNDTIITSFDTTNELFCGSMWDHFYKCCHPIHFEITGIKLTAYDDPFSDWDPNTLGFGPVRGQEIGIYGKTQLLIFDEWNVVVPGIQPFNLASEIPQPYRNISNGTEVIYGDSKFILCDSGVKDRAPLKSKMECLEIFKVTEHDSEGCWIEFQGNPRGLKILCDDDKMFSHITYDTVDILTEKKNIWSALGQLINWLWRSEFDVIFPKFETWFRSNVEICESTIFERLCSPRKCLNNLYLPQLSSHEERMDFCTDIWPFFFRHKKIFLYQKAFDRILNLMNVQDKYTRRMTPENFYARIPRFITDLISTDNDFDRKGSLIFNKKEHLKSWINYTNKSIYNQVSLSNMIVVNSRLYDIHSKSINPFVYKDHIGKIYIIQNVCTEEKKNRIAALEIAHIWKTQKRNRGPYYRSRGIISPNDAKYRVKMPNSNGILVKTEDREPNSNDYLLILMYRNGTYAAILEIL